MVEISLYLTCREDVPMGLRLCRWAFGLTRRRTCPVRLVVEKGGKEGLLYVNHHPYGLVLEFNRSS